jgi:hypothetical protein
MPGNTRTPLEATAGVGDAADGHVLGELVRELADALRVEQVGIYNVIYIHTYIHTYI